MTGAEEIMITGWPLYIFLVCVLGIFVLAFFISFKGGG